MNASAVMPFEELMTEQQRRIELEIARLETFERL